MDRDGDSRELVRDSLHGARVREPSEVALTQTKAAFTKTLCFAMARTEGDWGGPISGGPYRFLLIHSSGALST